MRLNPFARNVSRLEAFSDAVFAFAATLLVVSLSVPESYPELVAELKGFAGFALSFTALLLIWTVHQAYFRRYALEDRLLVALNSVLLFVVLFFVYPLKFVARGMAALLLDRPGDMVGISGPEELAALFVLYGAGFAGIFLCFALMYWHAWRRREFLHLDRDQANEAQVLCRHYFLFVAVALLSIGVARAGWGLHFGLPGILYSLLGPVCWAHGVYSERRARRAALARPTPSTPTLP